MIKDRIKTSLAGRIALIPYRFLIACRELSPKFFGIFPWLISSREYSTFSIELDERGRDYLASFISNISKKPLDEILGYIKEVEDDLDLREHIKRYTGESDFRFISDDKPPYGARIGWYALVRATKPKLVVETGVYRGLGSCIIAAALKRNSQQGSGGKLIGLDIWGEAGFLFKPPYSEYGKIIFGSSLDTIPKIGEMVDIFIHDSDHDPSYELREFEAVWDKLSDQAIILSDNSHCSRSLWEFAKGKGLDFMFFKEEPINHWSSGGGIGAAAKRR